MLICFLIVIFGHIKKMEARVFCQDTNASPWTPLGISCPLNCYNIRSAVERLKMIDYEKIMILKEPTRSHYRKIEYVQALNINNFTSTTAVDDKLKQKHVKNTRNKKTRDFNFAKKFDSETAKRRNVFGDFKMDVAGALFENGTCPLLVKKVAAKPFMVKTLLEKCMRRSNYEEDFLRLFTMLLNSYVHSEYKFTEEMTSVLLEKILGKSLDLRHGIPDLFKLLNYMRNAIEMHEKHVRRDRIVHLKSVHCLSVHVPGCYCKTGYVESSGQCVRPSDCLPNTPYEMEYLKRIVVE